METKSMLSCPALSSPPLMRVMPYSARLPAMNAAQRTHVIMTLAEMMIQAASMTVTAERMVVHADPEYALFALANIEG